MPSRLEEIESELQTFDVKSSEGTLAKLREISVLYQQTAEEIVEQWIAYSCSNRNCGLTLERLESFQKEFLLKELSKPALKEEPQDNLNASNHQNPEDGVLDIYFTPEAKKKGKVQNTPDNARNRSFLSSESPLNNFSPSSFSPKCMTPSMKYKSRLHPAEITCKFGETENTTWKNSAIQEKIEILNFGETPLSMPYPFMFEKLRNRAIVLNEMIDDMAEHLAKKYGIEHWSNVRQAQSDEVYIVGRICCDGEGKMNPSSILLQGSQCTSGGATILLDVRNLPQYSLFPGQIIGFKGINQSGKSFVAKELLIPDMPSQAKNKRQSKGQNLQVVVACGPFKTKDSLSFEPLYDLMKYVVEYKPGICILMGPFLDSKNEEIEKGKFGETYEELFYKIITNLVKMTESAGTHLVVVPSSYRDVHHDFVYPCPPFYINELKDEPRLHFASDPCLLNINGVIFAVTSTDILLQLGKEEIWFPPSSSDRLKRLTTHLIMQRSFYPLYPPSEEINIDYDHAECHVNLPVKPHILITPSDLKSFIKDVDGCCCINPERLTKGMQGGTFSRLQIKFPSSNSTADCEISAEVLRI